MSRSERDDPCGNARLCSVSSALTLSTSVRSRSICHEPWKAWRHWARGLGHRAWLHGNVGLLRPGRPRREHRHHPRRARCGITLLDTGDFYGMGHNEMLIGDALASRSRDNLQISVKFGALRDPVKGFLGYDARPIAVNLPIRCDVSASTTSTSTGRRDSIPTCPSKTLSERSPTW